MCDLTTLNCCANTKIGQSSHGPCVTYFNIDRGADIKINFVPGPSFEKEAQLYLSERCRMQIIPILARCQALETKENENRD